MEQSTPPTPDPDRRRRVQLLSLGVGLAAVIAVVALVLISQSGDKAGDTDIEQASDSEVAALPQSGDTIGEQSAPVTITEYADLQCPICRQTAQEVIPDVLAGPVAAGDAKLRYANWPILGPDSTLAAQAALAAAEQDKMFDFVELFYENQGAEGSGYVTDEFLTSIAEKAGLDIAAWNKARAGDAFLPELKTINDEALAAGFQGTPSVTVSGPGGTNPIDGVPDAATITGAVDEVSQ